MVEKFEGKLRGIRPDGSFKTYVGEHVVYNSKDSVDSFLSALEVYHPKRLFIVRGKSGFVAGGEAHELVGESYRDGERIIQVAQSLSIPLVEGFIRTHDHTNQIFQIFTLSIVADEEDAIQGLELTYKNWAEAAHEAELAYSDAFIQYYNQNSYLRDVPQTVDLTADNMHVVTKLYPSWGVKTLADVQKDFPNIPMRDNTAIYDWGRVILQGEGV